MYATGFYIRVKFDLHMSIGKCLQRKVFVAIFTKKLNKEFTVNFVFPIELRIQNHLKSTLSRTQVLKWHKTFREDSEEKWAYEYDVETVQQSNEWHSKNKESHNFFFIFINLVQCRNHFLKEGHGDSRNSCHLK